MPKHPFHILYILQCGDGTYYVGITSDLRARIIRHKTDRGCPYTAKRHPVSLVYTETFPTRGQAMIRENQLKRWSHAKKKALIERDHIQLRQLAKGSWI